MRSLFMIQGIAVDPQNVNYVADRVITCCELGYGNGVDKFDFFLNYRVDVNRDIVNIIYWQLKAKGAHPFLDSVCLRDGEDWKQGFLRGIQNSRTFVPVISRAALERPKMSDVDHSYDYVLIEYETALRMKSIIGKPNFIVPLFVGEYVSVQGQNALLKFNDFSAALYSPSILPVATAAPAAPAVAAAPSTSGSTIPVNCTPPAVVVSAGVGGKGSGGGSIVVKGITTPVADNVLNLDEAWSLLSDPKRHSANGTVSMKELLEELDVECAADLEYLKEDSLQQIAALLREASAGKFLKFMNVKPRG